jgi:hypothetical protein
MGWMGAQAASKIAATDKSAIMVLGIWNFQRFIGFSPLVELLCIAAKNNQSKVPDPLGVQFGQKDGEFSI